MSNDEPMTSADRIRRAKYISWFCTGLASLSLALTFLLVLTLAQVGMRYRVLATAISKLPMKTESSASIEPLNKGVSDADLITEAFIREFVINRYSIIPDVKEMTRRFSHGGPIHRFSSSEMYAPFAKQKEVKKRMKDFEEATPVDVEIRGVSHIGRVWTVEFDKRTVLPGGKVSVASFVTSLEVDYLPSRVSFNPNALNPLGMVIIYYKKPAPVKSM